MARKRKTALGTPCAPAWDADWIKRVKELEAQLGRRVCGAAGMDGNPCPRASDHPTGRCTHHGGNHLVGGQPGNQNACIHGLYSRRLRTCDDRCPLWNECPFAAPDILELSPKQRPICVYEQLEYDALVEHYTPAPPETGCRPGSCFDELVKKNHAAMPKPHLHLIHTVALLQVMMGRAAAVLGRQGFTETSSASSDTYAMESTKVSPALEAFLRLAREHRHYYRELGHALDSTPGAPSPPVGLADVMKPIIKETEGVLEDAIEYAAIEEEKLRRERGPDYKDPPGWPIHIPPRNIPPEELDVPLPPPRRDRHRDRHHDRDHEPPDTTPYPDTRLFPDT